MVAIILVKMLESVQSMASSIIADVNLFLEAPIVMNVRFSVKNLQVC